MSSSGLQLDHILESFHLAHLPWDVYELYRVFTVNYVIIETPRVQELMSSSDHRHLPRLSISVFQLVII